MDYSVYRCKHCSGGLVECQAIVVCTACGLNYAVRDGVIDFGPNQPRFLTGSQTFDQSLSRLAKDATSAGYFQALENLAATETGEVIRYATDLSRTDFKFLLPLSQDATVLEIGAGSGLISLSLAPHVQQVYALEKIAEHAEFIQARATQEAAGNVSVAIGGGDCHLPYAPDSFDIVILNGVYEWLGFEASYRDVPHLKRHMLSEIHRVLRDS
ncbi:unnamed protein product, partial [marine sediment metagenome]